MCGIQILVTRMGSAVCDDSEQIWTRLTAANSRRGPDAHNQVTVQLPSATVRLGAHVLHLRGPHTQPQPMVSETTGDVLCWNGEVFAGLDIGSSNDGALLLQEIERQKTLDPQHYILQTFSRIEGPYAFVYLDRAQNHLWFARDYLGRRSLLSRKLGARGLLISSVADRVDEQNSWIELPAQVIYRVDLASAEPDPFAFVEYPWHYARTDLHADGGSPLTMPFGCVNQEISSGALLASGDGPQTRQLSDLAELPDAADWQPYVDRLEHELTAAISARVSSIPANSGNARVGLLFSGGVDCITIAALLTRILPPSEPIELFNVAFENPRQAKQQQPTYAVPDRKTGVQGWRELQLLDPRRDWRFVEVDVPYAQAQAHMPHIRQLLVPADTVMDMSIALAIWFASRGRGTLVGAGGSAEYVGRARVLLLGMGADEQLGGYSRHRSAWDAGGWPRLGQEIALDVRRIALRNLGRDDRVVSDNGKEARFPFLAAGVVDFLCDTPLNYKMDMRYPRGVGEKLLLRLLARRLGLVQASMLAKRAIQFGARTAKMESGQTRGQDAL
ncbi:hypothetical protein H4S01_002710 [Coemansia sp. RSA 2610]|nr:hypothetical protein H4S01_002710 [Coemansia sp. RSA 2610]